MRIGYDAKRLFTNFTGLGNYSRSLVHHYHKAYPDDELFLFTPEVKADPRTQPFLEDSALQIIKPTGFKPLWRLHDITKAIHQTGVNVYHGLSHELPLGISKLPVKKIVTMHDVIFKYYPSDNKWFDRKIYDWKWKHACVTADVIIAISEQTKHDLIYYYNAPPEKIKVIYQSADASFSKLVTDDEIKKVKQKYQLPEIYNLYVGSVISRKNLLAIIKAMIMMKASERSPLVIIGQGKEYKNKVITEAKRGGIDHLLIWLGSPLFEDFPAIYKGGQMMIYPSLHEGFGLPVIEAMHVGIPVITSDQSSLREAGGNAASLIKPGDNSALANAMIKISGDRAFADSMIQRGYEHAKKFSPDTAVALLK